MHDVEFDLLEGRGHLVLDDLHARGVADDIVSVLDLAGAANVETDGSIKFQCITACRGLRITIHHTDLHAHLIDEDDCAARTDVRTGKIAEPRIHETGLRTEDRRDRKKGDSKG